MILSIIATMLSVIGLLFLLILFVDCFPRMNRHMERRNIGDFSSDEEWYIAAKNINNEWIAKMPVMKISDQDRFVLYDILRKQYSNSTVQSWQLAALLKGEESVIRENMYFDYNSLSWLIEPRYIDFGFLGFEVLQRCSDKHIKGAMDKLYEVIIESANDDGIILYRKEQLGEIAFVDTIGLALPFLSQYGSIFAVQDTENLVMKNIIYYYENSMFENKIIPPHAIDLKGNMPLGSIGWGRGVGWFLLGIIDSFEFVAKPENIETLKIIILRTAESISKYERKDGGFSCQLLWNSQYDSSATAVIGYFYAKAYSYFGIDSFLHIAERCLRSLEKNTRKNGKVDFSQGDTKDIGYYSVTFDIMPFTQGFSVKLYDLVSEGKNNE